MVQAETQQQYYYGTGKRKRAIARVRLYPSQGEKGLINGKPLEEVFPWSVWQVTMREPFKVTGTEGKFSVVAKVEGGGVSAQSQAIRHGISKALVVYDESLRLALRRHGLLTRDARIKESKKYGLKRARRAPQYTKR